MRVDDKLREELMPINRAYHINRLLDGLLGGIFPIKLLRKKGVLVWRLFKVFKGGLIGLDFKGLG